MCGEFSQRSQQLVFVGQSLFLQLLQASGGAFFGTELLEFDAVVIPIQLLAQITNPPHKLALTCFSQRQALAALKNHFGHAAGFCSFDA